MFDTGRIIVSFPTTSSLLQSKILTWLLIRDVKFLDRPPSCWLNPLTPTAVSKPLEVIGSPTYVLACQEPNAPDSDINQTAGSPGRLSMWKNRCMHAAVCLLRAGQPKRAGNAAESGEFLGEFFWVEFDPMGVRGLIIHAGAKLNNFCQLRRSSRSSKTFCNNFDRREAVANLEPFGILLIIPRECVGCMNVELSSACLFSLLCTDALFPSFWIVLDCEFVMFVFWELCDWMMEPVAT